MVFAGIDGTSRTSTSSSTSRLRALRATELIGMPADVLDRLARLASRVVGVPIAAVTLVDDQVLHFVGQCGLPGDLADSRRLDHDHAVCDRVVASAERLVIHDLAAHPIAQERPGLLEFGVRAYAGVPLTTRAGQTLGTVCVLDHVARQWSDADLETLGDLAQAALAELELRITLHEQRSGERRFRAFMDHSPVVAAMVNARGELEYVNAMFEWHFGVEPATVMGRHLETLTMPLAKVMRARMDQVLREGHSIERTEILASPNGDERQWLLYTFPVEGSDERTVGTVAVDLTDRRRLERQLQQAQRLESIGQLAAGIAHEINTPVQYVADNVRFLRDSFGSMAWLLSPERPSCDAEAVPCALARHFEERLPPETAAFLHDEVPRALEQSLEGLERIASIVRSIKEFSHPGGTDAVLVDINNTLSLAIKMARNEWKYVADCETDFEPALPLVSCFAGELNQAFLNIVVNAAHAMRESGRHGLLRVVTRLDGDFVRVLISDTGNGIPAAIRNKVFDPFFTTKPVGTGTGQGLAIAHSVIVEKHGGRISFDCVDGKGTTFDIRLPVKSTGVAVEDIPAFAAEEAA